VGWFDKYFLGQASAKKDLEDKRKKGHAVTGKEMTSAHQGALKSMLKEESSRGENALDKEIKRRKVLGGY
jgi:hypothetical protein